VLLLLQHRRRGMPEGGSGAAESTDTCKALRCAIHGENVLRQCLAVQAAGVMRGTHNNGSVVMHTSTGVRAAASASVAAAVSV
jgi:hypothetical protein